MRKKLYKSRVSKKFASFYSKLALVTGAMASKTLLFSIVIILSHEAQLSSAAKDGKTATKSRFGNFLNIARGQVLDKEGVLIRRFQRKSEDECLVACVNVRTCLSINLYLDYVNQPQCELLNWAGTAFHSYLKPRVNSTVMMLETACSPNPCQNGGQCIADVGGHQPICNCTKGFSGIKCQNKGCVLFDFEDGLPSWTRTGTAFNNQPTYGDNSLLRKSGETANLEGNWYVGTFDNRPSPSHPAGATQGNEPTGTMTSPKFIIQAPSLSFLIGGGSDGMKECVELLIGGTVVAKGVSLRDTSTMKPQTFNVTNYLGQAAQLRIVDNGTGSWGSISVDHFHTCVQEEEEETVAPVTQISPTVPQATQGPKKTRKPKWFRRRRKG